MKRKLLVAAIAATMLGPVVAQAADVTVGGRVRVDFQKTDIEGADDGEINENKAHVRLQASEQTEGGTKIIAQLEVDHSAGHGTGNTAAGTAVESARILFVADFGTIVFGGSSPSGQWADLYGHHDIFHSTGLAGFDQGDQTGRLIAYANKFGAVKVVGALFAIEDAGADDVIDVMAARAIWSDGPLSIGAGIANFSEDGAAGAAADNRMALMATYDMGALMAGITVEQASKAADDADHTTIGVSLKAPLSDGWLVSGAMSSVSADDGASQPDSGSTMILNVQKAMAPGVTWYANYTSHNEEMATAKLGVTESVAIIHSGVNFSF